MSGGDWRGWNFTQIKSPTLSALAVPQFNNPFGCDAFLASDIAAQSSSRDIIFLTTESQDT